MIYNKMDFSKFLNDDFDVNTWINDAFKAHQEEEGPAPQNKRDVYAATLVTKLQVFIQEVNKSLEEMSIQVVNSMPRVLRDVEALKQEASYLKQQMQQVKEDVHNVEQKTSHTMKVLVLTDQVRNRVERSCAALREADNWSSLAAAIEDVFRAGDIHTIAVRLKSMQNSLEILKDSPDYDDKVMHLEALKNRLESQISPQAVAAFMHHNTDEAKKLQIIFSTIGRETELHKYYVKTYSSSLINQWQEIVANEDDKSNIAVMSDLFDLLLSSWHSQLPWCRTVFGLSSATIILVKLIVQVLVGTKPGLVDVIAAALENNEDPKLTILLKLHSLAKKFGSDIEESVVNVHGASNIDNNWSLSLADALWMPFAPFQMNYKDFETEILLTKLSEIVMDAGDLMDLTQVLTASASSVFVIALEAVDHCDKLTNFLGSLDLVSPLNTFFHNYTDKFSRALRTVNIQYGLNKKDSGDLDISDEHYYSLFQHALRVITTCGKLLQSFSDFEQKLMASILGSRSAEIALAGLLEPDANENQVRQTTNESSWLLYNYLKKIDEKEYRRLQDMLVDLKQTAPSQRSILPMVKQSLLNLNQQAHQLAFDIAFAQIRKQLALIPQLEIWNQTSSTSTADFVDESQMPNFSLPPTEYATTIGNLLMTLPQHLEPLAAELSERGTELSAMETALHTAKLPFSLEDGNEKQDMDNMADRWLTSIIRASEHTYVEACLQIPTLSAHTAKQLAADLDYMGNVVDSLGMPILKDITVLIKLLRTPEEDYFTITTEFPKKLSSSVARVRGIKDT